MLRRMFTVKFAYARSVSGSGDTFGSTLRYEVDILLSRLPFGQPNGEGLESSSSMVIMYALAVHLLRNSIHQMPTAGRIANIYQLTLRVRGRKVAFLIHQTLVLTRQRGRAIWQRGLDDQCERAMPQRFAGNYSI